MHIHPFGVEQWMNAWETRCELNLAETCVESLTVAQLLHLCGTDMAALGERLAPMKLTYGAIEGSARLRAAVAALYTSQAPENVLITHGTIGANHLVHTTLVEPGDHVISVHPTYEQHYAIPASIGARVDLLRLRPENGWLPDLQELRSLVRPDTRLIAINNPNNPTGALMDSGKLREILAIAEQVDAHVLCDEVYRGTDQPGAGTGGTSDSVADLSPRGISTAGMSKAFSLAGLRLGWIVAEPRVLRRVEIHRDYTTISVGMIDDLLAALALENASTILGRSRELLARNLALVAHWIDGEPLIDWVAPVSGTTALLRYDLPTPSRDLCVDLVRRGGVMLTPGSAMDMEGYVRLGFGNNPDTLARGLARLSDHLRDRG